MSIITLITDFGNKDHFVAKIKGDIYSSFEKAKIVDIADFSTTIEVTGDPGKITKILNILKPYQIIEIVRTGKISVERELGINSELLRSI